MSTPEADSLYNWKDVTLQFKNACSKLKIGELVKETS